MMKSTFQSALLIGLLMSCLGSLQCYAQTASPSPKPTPSASEPQERVKVFTEEVVIPVHAFEDSGHLNVAPQPFDVIVFEDDVRQQVRSIRKVPASVMLLLDTAGELNPAMNVKTTREIATHLISHLQAGDRLSAIQFGDRVELIQDWTTERDQMLAALNSKLFSGKRSRLVDALITAAAKIKEVPAGTRHLVLVTDGVDASDSETLSAAIQQLLNSNVTVHVISYTAIGRKAIQARTPLLKITTKKRKSAQDIAEEIMNPTAITEAQKRNKLYLVIDTDVAMRRRRARYREATRRSEEWLSSLAEETGGMVLLPETTTEMVSRSDEVGREIDSQYIVTYTPKRPLSQAAEEEYRNVKVASGRVGLHVRARRGYVAKPH